jgi:hypothetical protein
MAVTATLECGCRRSLPPLHRSAKLGWRACCGFASVHRLPRPRGYIPAHVETRTVSSGSPPFQLKSCVLRRGRACRAAHSVGQEWAGSAFSWIENPTVSCVQGYSGCPVLKKNTSCWVARPVPLGTTRPRRCAQRYRVSMHELGADDSLRCFPATPWREIELRAGCWRGSAAELHWSPCVTVQAVTARCVGRSSPN